MISISSEQCTVNSDGSFNTLICYLSFMSVINFYVVVVRISKQTRYNMNIHTLPIPHIYIN